MDRTFAVTGAQGTTSSSTKTSLGLTSATTVRPRIRQIAFGASGTPADNALSWILQRYTAAGTNTSVTPKPLDPAQPASNGATAGKNHTVEPTYTSGEILFTIALNQKASFVWYAAPGCELVLPATANNGVGIGVSSAAYTGQSDNSLIYEE